MQNAMRTSKSTRRSSLSHKKRFTIPEGWGQVSQQQLQHLLSLMSLYGDHPEGMLQVKTWALCYLCGFEVIKKTGSCWLCRGKDMLDYFLLDSALLPWLLDKLEWLEHPEEMTVHLEVEGYTSAHQWLRDVPFGEYLVLENYYQTYLNSKDADILRRMFAILYHPKGEQRQVEDYMLLSVFLWYTAIKQYYSQVFTHFLKPIPSGQQTVTPKTQREMVNAQIRLLTKGDITKNQAVMNVNAWDAMTELDALAMDNEEFKRKYGKHG